MRYYRAESCCLSVSQGCPCGNLGHPRKACRCLATQIAKYRGKLSGPLLDRIDLHIEVPPVPFALLTDNRPESESSATIRERICKARKVQAERYHGQKFVTNALLSSRQIKEHCVLTPDAADLLKQAMERFGLSARSYDKLRKVSRTIADLDNSEKIEVEHISEALQYRALDRKVWL
ncbi:MAG: ATP-binding protein [Candidatus Omnitrophota bacterium]